MEEFVYGVAATTSAEIDWTWIEDYEFLREHRVGFAVPWIMPTGDNLGSQRIDVSRAKESGLAFRPLAVTAKETLEWYYSESVTDEQRADPPMVITREHEREVLEAWRARRG
jgi:2'-hydroxyisoflavone reductase